MPKKKKKQLLFTRRNAIALNILDGSPEQRLWKFVLCQAIEDATSDPVRRRRRRSKADALQWLAGADEDFKIVCELAGYNPTNITRNVAELIENYNRLP